MSRTLKSYRDAIRGLRDAGYDLPASKGYRLSGQLSPGIKSAITRAQNQLADRITSSGYDALPRGEFYDDDSASDVDYYADGLDEDSEPEWFDIDYFMDYEYEEFLDEDEDSYGEEAAA